jgi:hypothetical protein
VNNWTILHHQTAKCEMELQLQNTRIRAKLYLLIKANKPTLTYQLDALCNTRFEVFVATEIKVMTFWVVMPCSDVVGYQHFRGSCHHHLTASQPIWPELVISYLNTKVTVLFLCQHITLNWNPKNLYGVQWQDVTAWSISQLFQECGTFIQEFITSVTEEQLITHYHGSLTQFWKKWSHYESSNSAYHNNSCDAIDIDSGNHEDWSDTVKAQPQLLVTAKTQQMK